MGTFWGTISIQALTIGFLEVVWLFVYRSHSLRVFFFFPPLGNLGSICLPKKYMISGSHVKINLMLNPSALKMFSPAAPVSLGKMSYAVPSLEWKLSSVHWGLVAGSPGTCRFLA